MPTTASSSSFRCNAVRKSSGPIIDPRDEALAEFLRHEARRPFAWGRSDCALFLADWVRLRLGVDPAAHLRGRYSAPTSAAGIAGLGGLRAVVARCSADVGLARTRQPMTGDIAVIDAGPKRLCAIRTPTGWAVRADRAIECVPADAVSVIAAWRVP